MNSTLPPTASQHELIKKFPAEASFTELMAAGWQLYVALWKPLALTALVIHIPLLLLSYALLSPFDYFITTDNPWSVTALILRWLPLPLTLLASYLVIARQPDTTMRSHSFVGQYWGLLKCYGTTSVLGTLKMLLLPAVGFLVVYFITQELDLTYIFGLSGMVIETMITAGVTALACIHLLVRSFQWDPLVLAGRCVFDDTSPNDNLNQARQMMKQRAWRDFLDRTLIYVIAGLPIVALGIFSQFILLQLAQVPNWPTSLLANPLSLTLLAVPGILLLPSLFCLGAGFYLRASDFYTKQRTLELANPSATDQQVSTAPKSNATNKANRLPLLLWSGTAIVSLALITWTAIVSNWRSDQVAVPVITTHQEGIQKELVAEFTLLTDSLRQDNDAPTQTQTLNQIEKLIADQRHSSESLQEMAAVVGQEQLLSNELPWLIAEHALEEEEELLLRIEANIGSKLTKKADPDLNNFVAYLDTLSRLAIFAPSKITEEDLTHATNLHSLKSLNDEEFAMLNLHIGKFYVALAQKYMTEDNWDEALTMLGRANILIRPPSAIGSSTDLPTEIYIHLHYLAAIAFAELDEPHNALGEARIALNSMDPDDPRREVMDDLIEQYAQE